MHRIYASLRNMISRNAWAALLGATFVGLGLQVTVARADVFGYSAIMRGGMGPAVRNEYQEFPGQRGNIIMTPVFDLPEGWTANSLDGSIVDNMFVPIPEPSTIALAGLALVGLGFAGLRKKLLFCAPFVIAPLVASAAPITVPTGLNIGDQYRLAFVTSTARDATSSNIADYNNFVAAVAAAQPELSALGTTWAAIGSTTSIDARDNTLTHPSNFGVPIYRLDDVRIAHDNSDLWDGSLLAPLTTDQAGILIQTEVWTGTKLDGTLYPNFGLGDQIVIVGVHPYIDFRWIIGTTHFSDSGDVRSLYAISGVLTVVPEPGTMTLVCIGASALVGWQLRRRRHGILFPKGRRTWKSTNDRFTISKKSQKPNPL